MKSKVCFLFLLLFSFTTAISQTKVITGKVTNGNGEPLSGATVAIKGTTTATTVER